MQIKLGKEETKQLKAIAPQAIQAMAMFIPPSEGMDPSQIMEMMTNLAKTLMTSEKLEILADDNTIVLIEFDAK